MTRAGEAGRDTRRRGGQPIVAIVAVALVVTAGCHGGGQASSATTVAATAPATTAVSRSTVPTVPTTPIPGVPATSAPAAGTLPPQPTTPIPRSAGAPASTAPPGTAPPPAPAPPAAATTVAPAPSPGSTAPPATAAADGDPATFCPAVEQLIPLFYVITIGGLRGSDTAAAYEVAVAPALTGPLTAAAASAPAAVAAPFKAWADRTGLALAAFKAAGASDSVTSSFGQNYAAQIDAVTSKGGTQNPPDPVNAAVSAGVNRNGLMSSAAAFGAANGTFDAFGATFGSQVALAPPAEQTLEQRFPCAADLANFSS